MARKHLNSTHCAVIMALLVSYQRQNRSQHDFNAAFQVAQVHYPLGHLGCTSHKFCWELGILNAIEGFSLISTRLNPFGDKGHRIITPQCLFTYNHLEQGKNIFQHFSAFAFTWHTISLSCITNKW